MVEEVVEVTETPEVEVEEEPVVAINLPILKIIKKEQLEHGLRHRDYAQYRKYCTNRARRFRKYALPLSCNNRFQANL